MRNVRRSLWRCAVITGVVDDVEQRASARATPGERRRTNDLPNPASSGLGSRWTRYQRGLTAAAGSFGILRIDFASAMADSRATTFYKAGLLDMHCESKNDTKLLPITSRNINRFSNFFFTDGLVSKFATHPCLNIPPRIEHVATLPREI